MGKEGSNKTSKLGRSHKVGFEQNQRPAEEIIPMRRPGTVEEAAGALYLFCLPESDYITGEIITAGGGYCLITVVAMGGLEPPTSAL